MKRLDYVHETGRLAGAINIAIDALQRGHSPLGVLDGLRHAQREHRTRIAAAEAVAPRQRRTAPSAPRAHTGD